MLLQYSLSMIQAEVLSLLQQGMINPQQPIYTLSKYIPEREWKWVEQALEENEFLLRDRIGDLVASKDWRND